MPLLYSSDDFSPHLYSLPHPQYLYVHTLSSLFRLRFLPSCSTSKQNTSLSAFSLPETGLIYWSPSSVFWGALKIIPFVVCFCHFNSISRGRRDEWMCLFYHTDPLIIKPFIRRCLQLLCPGSHHSLSLTHLPSDHMILLSMIHCLDLIAQVCHYSSWYREIP